MKKKLPKFKSEEEEARFWETHSALDYHDEFTEVKEPFTFSSTLVKKAAKNREGRKRHLTLRMGQQQINLAKGIARYKGLGYQTLMRMWVIEGIHKELKLYPAGGFSGGAVSRKKKKR